MKCFHFIFGSYRKFLYDRPIVGTGQNLVLVYDLHSSGSTSEKCIKYRQDLTFIEIGAALAPAYICA
jgi:hypothetical protein